jgi:hypothetical protein
MSTQIDLGPVLPILKGDWDATTVYERLNIVRHNSASWICSTAVSQGVEPAENSTDWYLQAKDMSSVSSVNGMKGDVEITTIQTPSNDSDDTSITNTEWVRDRIDEKIDNAYEYTDNAVSAVTTSILDIAAQDASSKATIAVNQALAASETKFAAKETVSDLTNSISALTEKNIAQDTAIAAAQSTANSKQDKLGFTPIQQGGGIGQVGNKICIGWSGKGLKCTVDNTDLGTFVRSVNGVNADATGNVNTFPSGTKMLFNQAAAPTGWTKQTSVNDAALRVVSGNGGGTGGSENFSTAFAGKTVSISGKSGATTLTVAQMPSHSHSMQWLGQMQNGVTWWGRVGGPSETQNTHNTGGSGSHTHSISGSATVNLAVKYTDVIICAKN